MIRIDEIYYNTFLPVVKQHDYHSIHWFDPFGSVDFNNLCSVPSISSALPDDPNSPNNDVVRYLFWDQEPLHLETANDTLSKFVNIFNTGTRHLVTSEHHSEFVEQICDMYDFESHYYFFHAWASLDWYRGYDRTFLSKPFRQRQPIKTFLCPNNIIGGKRKHRLLLLDELIDRELIYNNLISFPATCPYEKKTVVELCQIHDIHLGHVDLPLIIDQGTDYARNSHRIDLWSQAEQTLLQVVTETVYQGRRQHLTEKTFKPIVMQQPFILVSCKNSLEYLRRYGFKTFSAFWNEDYDEYDDQSRIMRIGKLLSDLDNMTATERVQLQTHVADTVEYNKQWFYSREFENILWKELTTMISQW